MIFSKISKFLIAGFLLSPLHAQDSTALPEGLEKHVIKELISENKGDSLLRDSAGNITFRSELKVKNIHVIEVKYFHNENELGDAYYYGDLFFMGIRSQKITPQSVRYEDYIAEWNTPGAIGARDTESEILLQRPLTPKMIEDPINFLNLPSSIKRGEISFSAKSVRKSIFYYEMILTSSINLSYTVEYFPTLGFFRSTFQEPVNGSIWIYREWPQKPK